MRASCDNHVGLRTGDLEAAARFWAEALDGRLANTPVERGGPVIETIYGAGSVIKVAQVTFAEGGGGIELFQFTAPVHPIPPIEQRTASIMHFAMTVDDIDGAVRRIAQAGGRALMAPMIVAGADSGPRFVYCESPEGHPFELVTVDHQAVIAFVRELRRERPS